MPGLLGAQRRLRPRQRARRAPSSTATSGSSTGQKVWTSLAHWPTGASCVARTDPGAARDTMGCRYLLVPMRPAGHRDPSDRADHGHVRVQRGVLRRRPTARDNVVGEPGDGWKVAMGTLGFERGVVDPRPAGRLPPRTRRAHRPRPRTGAARRPGHPRTARPRLHRAAGHARARVAHAVSLGNRHVRPDRGVGAQALLGDVAPRARRARDGRARCRRRSCTGRRRADDGSGCSCSPAPTPSTAAPTRSSATSSPSAPSACPGEARP